MNRFAESGYRLELVRGVIRSVSVVIAISWFSIAAALVMLALALRERRLGSNLNPSKLSVEYGALIVASVGIVCQLCGLVVYFSNISLGFLDFGWILYDFAWMFFFLVVWTDVRALHWLTGGPRADSQGGVGVVAWTKEDL